jgi:hypothetical protein
MSDIEMNPTARPTNSAMQSMTGQNIRLLCITEMKRLNDRVGEFCAEVRRQEDVLRELYPAIASAFRVRRAKAPGANDNRLPAKSRPHP